MKKALLFMFSIIATIQLYAQNVEFSVGANTGLFHYSGNGATANSYIQGGTPNTLSPNNNIEGTSAQANAQNRTYNPYGSNNGWSYGAYAQLQYVTKAGFIVGSQFGYDVLRSKVNITGIAPFEYYLDEFPGPNGEGYPVSAVGRTYLQDELVNLSPYIGYRLKTGKVKIDLMPGVDFGIDINSYDKGKATFTNPQGEGTMNTYQTDYKLTNPATDVRLKFGVAADYRKWGLTLSYAHGLTKYLPYIYTTASGNYVHTELLRMGISYRIK